MNSVPDSRFRSRRSVPHALVSSFYFERGFSYIYAFTGKLLSKLREIVSRVLLALGGCVGALLVLEVVVRLIEPREVMRYFFEHADPVLHHAFVPNATGHYKTAEFETHYAINSLGLRDREIAGDKPPGVVRILMVGDSYTEGDGVEADETFSKCLERELRKQFGQDSVEVINAGVGSYSSLLEYLYLRTRGIRLKPDLVILNFDLSDVYDDLKYTAQARFDSSGIPSGVSPDPEQADGSFLVTVKDFFKQNTRLYNFVRLRIDRYLEAARRGEVHYGDLRFDKYAMLRASYHPFSGNDWKTTEGYLLLIRDLLRREQIGFWLTVYPYGNQVSRTEWAQGRLFWGFRPDTVYSTWPQEHLVAFCQAESIRAINLCGAFVRASGHLSPLYLPYNGHWTPLGHRVVADALEPDVAAYVTSLRRRQ